MKKSIITVIVSALLLMPALGNSPKKSKAKDSSYTPENSVVFYGEYEDASETVYFQCDLNYEPDLQKFSGSVMASDPVPVGSTYRLYSSKGKSKGTLIDQGIPQRVTFEWDEIKPIDFYQMDFKIPKKPGLYYAGTFKGWESNYNYKLVPSDKDAVSCELKCLKAVLKKYKGTAWEKIIAERIEELETMKKEQRENKKAK